MGLYTPTAVVLPAQVARPEDGEAPTGAILGGTDEVALDAIRFLTEKVSPGTFNSLEVGTWRHCSPVHVAGGVELALRLNGGWVPVVGNYANDPPAMWELFPPDGAVVIGVRFYIGAFAGHDIWSGGAQNARLYSIETREGTYHPPGESLDGFGAGAFSAIIASTTITSENATVLAADGASATKYAHRAVTDNAGLFTVDRATKRYFVAMVGAGHALQYALPPLLRIRPTVLDPGAG